jgi:hypothetical protein
MERNCVTTRPNRWNCFCAGPSGPGRLADCRNEVVSVFGSDGEENRLDRARGREFIGAFAT